MSKKKRFGVSHDLARGFTETISVVENNENIYRNATIPLTRIELDPDNPRKLTYTMNDAISGISTNDPLYNAKHSEQQKLNELAETIKTSGLINPIVVFKFADKYRVVAGERRCLASILAGKSEIEARIFNDKPTGYMLKLVQWVENTAREDLSLYERVENIIDIYKSYIAENPNNHVTATLISEITGLSLSQSSYYLTVINAGDDIKAAIKDGHIQNLDKAVTIAKISSNEKRKEAILACKEGANIKQLRDFIASSKNHKTTMQAKKRGREAARVNLGYSTNIAAIKKIMDTVLQSDEYTKYTGQFAHYDYKSYHGLSRAFKELILLIEKTVEV